MKKKISLTLVVTLLICTLTLFTLVSCGNNDGLQKEDGKIVINVCVPDGSPAIAIAKLIKSHPEFEGYKINYEVVTGAEGIGARLASGQATIAIAPTNVGAIQYNANNGRYRLVATAVQGALYMVGKGEVVGTTTQEKLNSLKGKTVYNIGQGATPDLTFKYVLETYDIPYQVTDVESNDYVALKYVSAGDELIKLFKQNGAEYGIMGEPAVTRANANTGTTTLFSMQDLWNEVTDTKNGFPQASVLVNSDLLDGTHNHFINWFLSRMEENSTWVTNNAKETGEALELAGSKALKGLSSDIVAKCNIKVVRAEKAKVGVTTYLTALHSFSPKTVGGKVPNDNFYYAV